MISAMHPARRLAATLAAASLMLVLAGLPVARAACPTSTASFGSLVYTTQQAAYSVTQPSDSRYQSDFDISAARLHTKQPGSLSGASIEVVESFDVVGVPPGTAVPVWVVLRTEGTISTTGCGGGGCAGFVDATIRHGAETSTQRISATLFSGSSPIVDERALPITLVAGQPRTISFKLHGARMPGGNHATDATARFRFEFVPAGVVIRSCNGYAFDVTSARRTTWGRVKQLYR